MNPAHAAARRAAEIAARAAFGRLLSWLAWQWRDIAAAEDALSDALLKALESWPDRGVPNDPEGWLLAVAKRQLLQIARHDRVRFDPALTVLLRDDGFEAAPVEIPDARLKLLFVCAHPAIDERVRIPLMLQTVLGLQVADMAPALMMSPSTLSQRLVRAKAKIRDTGMRFEEPEADEMPARLQHVLEAIYGAYGVAIDAVDGAEARIVNLRTEARFLCELVCALMPQSAEGLGLWVLMTLIEARAGAREPVPGTFVSLQEQDTALWDRAAIIEADAVLWKAARLHSPGPFQLEAAVQSAHCHRLFSGHTPWEGIALLYGQINAFFPTQGSRVAGAVASAEAGNIAAGLDELEAMDAVQSQSFQPWWVARAHLLAMAGRINEAQHCFATAIGLTMQQRLRVHLDLRRQSLMPPESAPSHSMP